MAQRKIEIGQTYIRLKVVDDLGIRKHHGKNMRFYSCECTCGNPDPVEAPGTYIGRNIKSCGCLQKESRKKTIEPETRFGRLEVVGKDHLEYGRGYHYSCKCDCGKRIVVRGDRLRSGETDSCGCLHDEVFQHHVKKAYEKIFLVNFSSYEKHSMTSAILESRSDPLASPHAIIRQREKMFSLFSFLTPHALFIISDRLYFFILIPSVCLIR